MAEYTPIEWREIRPPRGGHWRHSYAGTNILDDSLVGAGILDGDIVIWRLTPDVGEGQLAAVFTPLGLAVRFFSREAPGSLIALRAANPLHGVKIWRPDEVIVAGVAVRIERDLEQGGF